MIAHGSDVHQGGDAPLMRAALDDERIAMLELLVAHGADVNASLHGDYPVIFAPCEAVAPRALAWLLAHGARPDPDPARGRGGDTALDYLLGTYARCDRLPACIDALLAAGGTTRHDDAALPGVLDLLRGRVDLLARRLDTSPALIERRFDALTIGTTAGRRLDLRGATLVHVAAEFGVLPALELLLARGADPDARGAAYGQTPLFHAASQYRDHGLYAVRLLLARGADPGVRARVPGNFEQPGHVFEGTALDYARAFPGASAALVALFDGSALT